MDTATDTPAKIPWNKGKIVALKAPLKLKDIWAIRIRLQLGHRVRELALFDLGLDSKLSRVLKKVCSPSVYIDDHSKFTSCQPA